MLGPREVKVVAAAVMRSVAKQKDRTITAYPTGEARRVPQMLFRVDNFHMIAPARASVVRKSGLNPEASHLPGAAADPPPSCCEATVATCPYS